MSERIHGNYQSMESSENRVNGSRFFVCVASETRNAHRQWIDYFKLLGHEEVQDKQDADYYLAFCPVKSRIKTDIDEALEKVPDEKGVILVVMHHTFDRNMLIMESRRQVSRPDVHLTIDCLFYEGRLLSCNLNRIARNQIQMFLRVSEPSLWNQVVNSLKNKKLVACVVGGVVAVALIAIIFSTTIHNEE